MSDLGEFGSPLPSYPTLPSPPNTDQHSQGDLLSSSTPPISYTTTNVPQPTSATSLDYDFPVNWQQHTSPRPPNLDGNLLDSPIVASSLSAPTDVMGQALPPTTSVPIYATVRKPAATNSRARTESGSPFSSSVDVQGVQRGQVQSPPTGVGTLEIRIQHLEQLCGKLSREKADMEEGFGRQRKSFMNQMAQTDAKLSLCKHTIDKYAKEVEELSKQVLAKDEELQNVTIAAGITEASIKERFDGEKVKFEEEVASLRKIVAVQSQDTNLAMQQDRVLWQQEKEALLKELELLQKEAASAPPSRRATSPPKSPSPSEENPDLEISMTKAAEDTKLLRAVVLPLEEEIKFLKAQLCEAENKLKEKEAVKVASAPASAEVSLIDLDSSLSVSELEPSRVSPMPTDVRELQNQLAHARHACNDLEMHTAQLNLQKSILKEEIKSLSEQLTQVSTDFEVEKLNCREMKRTWELANDHFIVAQDKLKQEIYRLHQKLERGEATSPLREIDVGEFPVPVIVERHTEGEEGADKEKKQTRVHRRSWSTDENSEATTTAGLQRLKSASWNSLQKPGETEEVEALSQKVQALEEELSKVKAELLRQKALCEGYEKQSLRNQEQMTLELKDKEKVVERLSMETDKYKAHVMRQRQVYEKLCRQMDDLKEEMRTRIETFQSNEQDLKGQQRILKDRFTEIKQDAQREIAKMSEDRRQVYLQLETLREEYDCLKAIQSSCVTDYQAQLADMRQSREETESKLNKVTVQLNSHRDQMRNVRDMLGAERASKEKLASKLNAQLEAANRRLEELTPMVAQLESARTEKESALAAKSETERKSRDFISEQRVLIEKLNGEKEKAATQVQELQRQVASLKHKLNHTEETQKDFVELSQSLQIRLAVMEEEKQLQQSLSPPPST